METSKICDHCGDPIDRILTLTDKDGVLLDGMTFCKKCWVDCPIVINDKFLSLDGRRD